MLFITDMYLTPWVKGGGHGMGGKASNTAASPGIVTCANTHTLYTLCTQVFAIATEVSVHNLLL